VGSGRWFFFGIWISGFFLDLDWFGFSLDLDFGFFLDLDSKLSIGILVYSVLVFSKNQKNRS